MYRFYLFLLLISIAHTTLAAVPQDSLIQYNNGVIKIETVGALMDESQKLTINDVITKRFTQQKSNFKITQNTIWVKTSIKNNSDSDSLFLEVKNPAIYELTFYTVSNNAVSNTVHLGRSHTFESRVVKEVTNFVYPLYIVNGNVGDIYIRIKTDTPVHLPLFLGKRHLIVEENIKESTRVGIYIGIILIMLFYNFFISLTVRDNSYRYYVLYIVFVGLAQLVLNGFANKYFWPNNTWLSINGYNMAGVLSGIVTGVFAKNFLRTRIYAPRINQAINIMIGLYLFSFVIHFLVGSYYAFNFINILAGIGAALVIYAAYIVSKKDYKPAKFFLLAFSVFLLAVIIYVLRGTNIIPYNYFTANILEAGSAIQITLLSFALTDKINTYRKEQNLARQQALRISKENERLVQEQNINLEKEVRSRTAELQQTNEELQQTLSRLKEAQIKLVDSEKMASLGQLTAGIAHEINNPINFVAANIKPLELDIKDLHEIIEKYEQIDTNGNIPQQLQQIEIHKKNIDLNYINNEIKNLLNGIKDGASRTAEIVSNLKSFARIDQSYMKFVNLNEGIESTIILVRNTFPRDLIVTKELGNIPQVECVPGKINQVIMNIITNAVQAIKAKVFEKTGKKILNITTRQENNKVIISVKDNGIGMTESVKAKIFEPFFTTKEVGEGTGLGMSIVKSIIDSHQGTIEIQSAYMAGTEFIITLPVTSKTQQLPS